MSYCVRLFSCLLLALANSHALAQSTTPAPALADPTSLQPLQAEYMQLLENTSLIVVESGLPTALIDEIQAAQTQVLAMPPEAFAELEVYLGDMVRELNASAEQRADRLLAKSSASVANAGQRATPYAAASLASTKSSGFPGREHFDLDWSFETDTPGGAPGGSEGNRTETGLCRNPGPSNKNLIDAKRDEIISFSVKVVAERFCEQTIAGINTSLACVPTDIVYYAFHVISESQQLCSSLMSRGYVDATFDGAGHIHERLGDLDSVVKNEIEESANRLISKVNIASNRIINERLASLRESAAQSINESGDGLETSIKSSEARIRANIAKLSKAVSATSDRNTRVLTNEINTRANAIDAALSSTQSFIQAFEDESKRILIEANLAEQGRPNNGFGPIASFQTASEITTVAAIVRQTIDRFMAAGENTSKAESQYYTASSMLSAGDFEGAYKWLGMAYQSATK